MGFAQRLIHRLAHRLRWNFGWVVTAVDRRGTVWIGFKCSHCGRVSGIHASVLERPRQEDFR